MNQIFLLSYLKMTKNFIKVIPKYNLRMDIGKFQKPINRMISNVLSYLMKKIRKISHHYNFYHYNLKKNIELVHLIYSHSINSKASNWIEARRLVKLNNQNNNKIFILMNIYLKILFQINNFFQTNNKNILYKINNYLIKWYKGTQLKNKLSITQNYFVLYKNRNKNNNQNHKNK